MEKLYCTRCDKTYSVKTEDIRRMQADGRTLRKEGNRFRFESGCFFKELTLLKRRTPHR